MTANTEILAHPFSPNLAHLPHRVFSWAFTTALSYYTKGHSYSHLTEPNRGFSSKVLERVIKNESPLSAFKAEAKRVLQKERGFSEEEIINIANYMWYLSFMKNSALGLADIANFLYHQTIHPFITKEQERAAEKAAKAAEKAAKAALKDEFAQARANRRETESFYDRF